MSKFEQSLISLSTSCHNIIKELTKHPPLFPELYNSQLFAMWIHPKGVNNLVKTIVALCENKPAIAAVPQITNEKQLASPADKIYEDEVKVEEDFHTPERVQLEHAPEEHICLKLSDEFNNESKEYSRGPYKSYTVEQKEGAVKMILQDKMSLMEASRCSGIPCKNIKRWATQGVLRKKGGGRRRYSPEMELSTYNWLCETYPRDSIVEMEKIQNYALGESDDESFKASRGWVLKFIQRFQLRDRFEIV